MSQPISVEALTADDYDEVVALWRSCAGVGLNESDERQPLTAFLARNPGLSLVARRDGAVIGAVLCGHDGRRGYLHHLAVAEGHRGQGLGRALTARCLASLAALGIPKCNVFVYADNDVGTGFWRAQGFASRNDLLVLQCPTADHAGSL